MNKILIPLIGIGALAGSAACLLAKKVRMKKKASWDIDFEDDEILADEFCIDDKPVRPGYIFESDLHDALMSLFRAYSDWEITGYPPHCTADDHLSEHVQGRHLPCDGALLHKNGRVRGYQLSARAERGQNGGF